jgi:hypothetical protein
MNKETPTKHLVAYRIHPVAVKTGQTTGDFHGIMNMRGLF